MVNYAYVVPNPHGDAVFHYEDTGRERFLGADLLQYRHVGQEDELWKIGTQAGLATNALVAHRSPADDVPSHGTENFTNVLTATGRFFYVLKEEATGDLPIYRWWVVGPTGSATVIELSSGDPSSISVLPDQRVQADFHAVIEDGANWSIWNMPNIMELASTGQVDAMHTNISASTWAAVITGSTANARTQPEAPDPFTVDLVSHGQHSSDGSSLYFSLFGETGDQFSAWEDAAISWSRGAGATGPVPVMNLDILRVEHIILDVPGGEAGDPDLPSSALPYNSTLDAIYRRAYRTAAGGEPLNAALGQLALVISELNPDDIDPEYCLNVEATLTGTSTITPTAPHAYKQSEYRLFNGVLDETSTYSLQNKGLPGSEVMHSDFIVQAGRGIYTAVVGLDQDADNYGGGQKFSVAVHFAPGEAITIAMGEQRSRFTG